MQRFKVRVHCDASIYEYVERSHGSGGAIVQALRECYQNRGLRRDEAIRVTVIPLPTPEEK